MTVMPDKTDKDQNYMYNNISCVLNHMSTWALTLNRMMFFSISALYPNGLEIKVTVRKYAYFLSLTFLDIDTYE